MLVCLPPAGILNLVMFIWIFLYHCLFTLVLKSPNGEWPITYTFLHLHLTVNFNRTVSLPTYSFFKPLHLLIRTYLVPVLLICLLVLKVLFFITDASDLSPCQRQYTTHFLLLGNDVIVNRFIPVIFLDQFIIIQLKNNSCYCSRTCCETFSWKRRRRGERVITRQNRPFCLVFVSNYW